MWLHGGCTRFIRTCDTASYCSSGSVVRMQLAHVPALLLHISVGAWDCTFLKRLYDRFAYRTILTSHIVWC